MIRFALAGNPNSGKTTLFNSLTGSTAHVGNWPGVTVDKREGTYKKGEEKVDIVDLPGIYSLSPYTPEEVISRNYILDEKPDCVINIVDATNLERNLYLTTQLLEMDVPIVVALNMMDMVEKNGDKINEKELEKELGIPVVKISALKEENLDVLMKRAIEFSKTKREGKSVLEGTNLKHLINDVKIAFIGKEVDNPLFHAIKIIENDEIETKNHPDLVKIVDDFKKSFKDDTFGDDFEAFVADARYKYITEHYSKSLVRKQNKGESKRLTLSDRIDRVLTNKWAGIPIFIVILILLFHLIFSEDFLLLNTFGVNVGGLNAEGEPLTLFAGTSFEGLFVNGGAISSPGFMITTAFQGFLDWINGLIGTGLEAAHAAGWAQSFICDGVIGGLFAIFGFLPQILLLFLAFSFLEDTGYMARVAFILDRIFRRLGISGRAFMPMIMGFGCSVPAIINTRTLTEEKERISTIRVIPFFSCGAKLPILTAVAGGLAIILNFPYPDLITVSMYLLGMVVAIICLVLMRNTTMRGDVAPFIMELPAYHMPQFKSLMIHLWDKTKHFVKKAFTIILFSTIIIWLLQHLTWDWRFVGDWEESAGEAGDTLIGQTILSSIGKFVQPIFTPLGFGSQLGSMGWVFAVAAVTGLVAKENCITTISVLALSLGATGIDVNGDGIDAMQFLIQSSGMDVAAGISFIAFNMLTIPCFAAVATAKGELKKGTLKWTLLFWIATSYIVSSLIYTVGTWWWTTFIWIAVIALAIVAIYLINKYRDMKVLKV
ncbi:MAG: ferrous iron transporter B [Firmicutes bacterium]|uniref:Fe(2+) transporter FeoB n=1 Tax=Candidatus Onthovivens merdipullorum TaxID=2840889 RepID=A0A9D9DJD7_9BACL|nr:ferrous iron transporter B [Candidatus Onthovivens merdipullorum]